MNELEFQVPSPYSPTISEVLHAIATGLKFFPEWTIKALNISMGDSAMFVRYEACNPCGRCVKVRVPVNLAEAVATPATAAAKISEAIRWVHDYTDTQDFPGRAETLADIFLKTHLGHDVYTESIHRVGCRDCNVAFYIDRTRGQLSPHIGHDFPVIEYPWDYQLNWGIPRDRDNTIVDPSTCTAGKYLWAVKTPDGKTITRGSTTADRGIYVQDEIAAAVWWSVYMGVPY